MSSIADALRRAQEERDRLRGRERSQPEAARPAAPAHSLASVVLKKPVSPPPTAEEATATAVETQKLAAPLTNALEQQPLEQPKPVQRQQRVADTIVEDYQAKRRLNLPASIVVYHERAGAVAQQYRDMRERLMAGNPKREPQALVFTSSQRGEGKTTSIMNLALTLCEVRSLRVLLIDGCLHSRTKGSLSQMLRLEAERGVAELFPVEEDAAAFVKPTPWHNLFIVPAGAPTTAPAATELLRMPTARAAVRQLRNMFDYVLIDAPAMDAGPDAGLLGASGDGLVLIAALRQAGGETIQQTVRRLAALNLPVKHALLTRVRGV